MPSAITDTVAERKSPKRPKVASPGKSISPSKRSNDLGAASLFERIIKSEPMTPSNSFSPSKYSNDLGAASLFDRIVKSEPMTPSNIFSPSKCSNDLGAASSLLEQSRVGKSLGSDANSLGDDTDSHSDRGRKKRPQRSRKAPETKARKTQSKSQQRRIVFYRGKANRKRTHGEDPDEVICKLDAWKKLHKSKAKANKQSSVNTSPSLAAHEIAMKQELIDCGQSIPSEYQLTAVSGDSGLAHVKTELVSDDANFVFTASGFGDQKPRLPLVEPKSEVVDFGFAVVKQEPADDYLYMETCDVGKIDTDGITPLFPIGEVVSLASVQIQVLGACYSLNEILQDDYWQPSVILKRFPIWILQNLAEGYNDYSLPQSEEVVDSWSNSFVSQGSLQLSAESIPFTMATGCNSESDSLKFDEFAVPPLSSIQLSFNSEEESSMKIDALPSDDIAQPLTKRFKSGPASKVRGRKTNKVKEREKKENDEESSKLVTEEPEKTEMPRHVGRPRRSSRMKPQMPEESEKHLEKENARKIPEKEKSGEILPVETLEPTEKISEVPTVEKKRKNEQRENVPKADSAELAPKRGRTRRETVETKKLAEKVDDVAGRKRILKGRVDGKVLTVGEKVRAGDEKKSKPKLGFVIPKKKPPDPNAALPGAVQPKAGGSSLVPSPASTLPRIPKLSKALSEEDKERSVLAKLDTEVGKREALKWDSRNSWTGKPVGTVNGSGGTEHQGVVGSQDKPQEENNWQRTVVDRFRLQNLNGRETMIHPLLPQQQQQRPKIPLLGIAPGISSLGGDWNRCLNTANQEWMNNCGPGMGPPQNCAPGNCFPSQPMHQVGEQWPIPTVGYSIPVIQSSERLTANNAAAVQPGKWNCQAERDPRFGPPAEPAVLQQRSEPVLREVPYVKDASEEVFSCYGLSDDDFDDDDGGNRGSDRLQNGRPCEGVAPTSSSAAVPQSFPLLEDPPLADNMDDSIRLFADAVQEAIEQGDISSEKCDRLVNLYEKLCRDLIAEDVTENQQNAEAAGIACDTVNQTLHKELRLIKDLTKNQLTASSAASDLLRSFGNADKCSSSRGNGVDYVRQKLTDQTPCRGGVDEDSSRHGKGLPPGYRAGNGSGSYRPESGGDGAAGSGSFDGRTNRSFAILQDDALWRDLLGQAQNPGMSEESLELLRRLLLEAAKRGVYDEQMVNMLNVVCQHIKLEDSKELSLRKEFRSGSAFQHSGRSSESVEIPFISEEQNFPQNKGLLRRFRKQDGDQRCATPISPVVSSRLNEVHGMSDSESESGFKGMFLPNRAADDKSAERIERIRKKQEDFAAKVLDEIRLLEMLVAIQCELAVVTPTGVPPIATRDSSIEPDGKYAEPVQPTEPGGLTDPILPLVSPAGSSKAGDLSAGTSTHPAVEKASSESCDTPSLSSELLMCGHPSTSMAGDESQDSHSTQKSAKSVKEKDKVIDKKSCDPKAIEEKVISMARNALKPHYHNGAITSEEFKLIMKKSIAKICKSRSTDISQKRITKFMNAYVEKVVQSRK